MFRACEHALYLHGQISMHLGENMCHPDQWSLAWAPSARLEFVTRSSRFRKYITRLVMAQIPPNAFALAGLTNKLCPCGFITWRFKQCCQPALCGLLTIS